MFRKNIYKHLIINTPKKITETFNIRFQHILISILSVHNHKVLNFVPC